MKKNKLFKILTLTLTLSSVGTVAAYADGGYWQQSGNNWYYKDDSSGQFKTGWIKDNGYWYYLGSDGNMKTGWIYDNGNWYYCYSNGIMATDTTISGYYLSPSGAWTTTTNSTSSGTALTAKDSFGTHLIRGDISQSQGDIDASEQLTNNNMSLNDSDKKPLKSLSFNLAQGRTTLDEARANCIGKVVAGKYKITDIQYFDQSFSAGGTNEDTKIKTIKSSNLSSYNTTNYVYDSYLVFSCFNTTAGKWEAMRIIVVLEAI